MNQTLDLLQRAIDLNASDLHFEPQSQELQVRARVNGSLTLITTLDRSAAAITNVQLKLMANLDIAEKRLPQDGKLSINNIDARISTCPTIFGEKIVIRFLSNILEIPELHQIGLTSEQLAILYKTLNIAKNLILVTGTTGSGKTTTLYSMLKYLHCEQKNICTVEDPVEINFPSITQVNVNYKLELTFSKIVRCFLRQDPDILLIGEIRDRQTAKLAIEAARLGCLVLASMHAGDCYLALNRLSDFGISKFDQKTSISLMLNQRLVLTQQSLTIARSAIFTISEPTL